jgi:uncharacterized protein (TIRG00374 family)
VPAKLGDAYRGYLLKHNGKVSFSATLGTIFAERILDMLALFALLVISGYMTFGTQIAQNSTLKLIFVSGLALVFILIAGLAGMRWLSPLAKRFMPVKVRTFYERFEGAALRSFRPQLLPRLLTLTAGVWLLEGFRLYFVIEAFGPEVATLSLSAIIFVALASSLLTALPITPAGLGVVEGTITAVLTLFGIATSLGIAVTLLDRLINFWSIIVGGLLLYIFSKRK